MFPLKVYSTQNRYVLPRSRFEYIDNILQRKELFRLNIHTTQYFLLMQQDITKFFKWIEGRAIYNEPKCKNTSGIKYVLSNNLLMNAECNFKELSNVSLNMTSGLVIAIDDLMHRFMCNASILAYDNSNDWYVDGDCGWLKFSGTYPKLRYYDYTAIRGTSLGHMSISDIGWLYMCIPYDTERIQLARYMSHIALTWVQSHEQAHYVLGHCHFIDSFENDISILSELDILNQFKFDSFNKHIEWQADIFAVGEIFDIFFTKEWLDHVPTYVGENRVEFLFRILTFSIISTCLIVQKNQEISGVSSNYPKAMTRIIYIIRNALDTALNSTYIKGSKLSIDTDSALNSISLVFEEIFTASEIVYTKTDQIKGLNNNFEKNFKPLSLIDNKEELDKLTYAFSMYYFRPDDFEKEISDKKSISYFEEYDELKKNQKIREGKLKPFRKKATHPLSVYGE